MNNSSIKTTLEELTGRMDTLAEEQDKLEEVTAHTANWLTDNAKE